MKQKELTKTFMMKSNCKKTLGSWFIQNISSCIVASLVANITFVVAEITFKVAMNSSWVIKINVVVA